jgi:hypothetical protein
MQNILVEDVSSSPPHRVGNSDGCTNKVLSEHEGVVLFVHLAA